MGKILYICDRLACAEQFNGKQCPKLGPCKHTSNREHAKYGRTADPAKDDRFELINGDWWEKDRKNYTH